MNPTLQKFSFSICLIAKFPVGSCLNLYSAFSRWMGARVIKSFIGFRISRVQATNIAQVKNRPELSARCNSLILKAFFVKSFLILIAFFIIPLVGMVKKTKW